MPRSFIADAVRRCNVAKQSTAISVGAASVTLANANSARAEITVVNDHATQILYLTLNTTDGTTVPTAVVNSGIRLNAAGGSWTSNAYTGPIAAIATGATTPALVTEI